ncbi:MAG TPA: DNA-formamidopyrimidine glycosylase family protein [Vicinamibacterales bacterium]
MPEGDTIFLAAATLHRVFAGKIVTAFESVLPSLTRVDAERPLAGRTIESVTSRGKHMLMSFSGDLTLHTHMRMNGSWHVYRPGERWRRPARDMRIVVATSDALAVGFNIPVAEFLTGGDLARHRQLQALGPDLLDPAFDRAAAQARIRMLAEHAIADVLLNQGAIAGIGNVFKSEILFMAGVDPFTRVADLGDDAVDRLIDTALKQLRVNVVARARSLAPRRGRRTTGSLHPDKGLWVYGRGGLPCRKCGTTILTRKTGDDARLTYWCPRCQVSSS